MKKLFAFILGAVAILITASCAEEINGPGSSDNGKERIITVIATDKPAVDDDSKTYIDGTSVKWSETGEYLKVFEVATPLKGAAITTSAVSSQGETTDSGATMTFGVSLDDKSGGSYSAFDYFAFYPSSAYEEGDSVTSIKLNTSASQTPSATNFDASQDLLIAKKVENGATQASTLSMQFARVVAIGKMTIKNLGTTDPITKISFSAKVGDTPVALAGCTTFDLETARPVGERADENQAYSIELNYVGQGITANTDEGMVAYFTCYPFAINSSTPGSFKVVVETASQVFIKKVDVSSDKGLAFNIGKASVFSVNMAGVLPLPNTNNYLILAKNDDRYYAMKAEKDGSNDRMVSVEYDGSLVSYNGDSDMVWSVSRSGESYLISNSSKYLGFKGSDNKAYWLEDDENWTTANNYGLSVATTANTGVYNVTHPASSRYLSKNTSNPFFAFYVGTNQYEEIVFVPATVDPRTEVVLSFDESSIVKTTANYNEFTGQTATAVQSISAITSNITYSIEGDAIGTINSGTGAVTLNGTAGFATVTASFDGDEDYRPAEASYTITVSSTSETGWIETAITDLGASDVFVIVGNTGPYAMTNNNGTSNPPAVSSVNVSGTKLNGEIVDNIKWNITGNEEDGFVFYPNGSTTTWLYCTDTNNGVRVGTNANKLFTIDNSGYLVNKATSRYISIYSNQDWRCYSNTENNPQRVKFYKYVDDPRDPAPIAWKKGDDTRTTASVKKVDAAYTWLDPDGAQPTLTITTPLDKAVTYSSSVTSVATINSSTGVISLAGVGSTEITATYEGSEGDQYKHTEVSYTLTVTPYYAVTFISTPDHGSFSVKNGETTISSGALVPAGATINVTDITPADGYALATLVYNDGDDHDIKAEKTFTMPAHAVTVTATFEESGGGGNATDVLNLSFTGVSGTNYVDWSGKTSTSGAVYAGNSAGGNNAIQLRSNNNNSGIVTTTSGGTAARVSVSWNSNTTDGRTLNVYGHTVAYSAASDLYEGGDPGTLLGTIVKGTSTQLIVSDSYSYIGLRSASGAMYLDEIDIEWGEPIPTYAIAIDGGITHGSVSASPSGSQAEGTSIALTATPDVGYMLDAWDVYKTGDSSTKVEVTSNSFTMPAYGVTVSASFVAIPTISMNTSSISGVAAAGTTTTASAAYNLLNGAVNGDVTITCDGTVVTAASKNATAGNIDYTVAANTGAARDGWIKVTYGTEDPHQITVSQLAATYILTLSATNGTVTASVGGTPKYDGDDIECGATVNITATPDDGYAFSAWDVYKTGDSSTKVEVTSNSFTMPAYGVTASASFVESGENPIPDPEDITVNATSLSGTYCSITFAKLPAGSSNPAVAGTGVRAYVNNTITISSASYNIDKVDITCKSNQGGSGSNKAYPTSVTADIDGSFSPEFAFNGTSTTYTYTLSNDSNAVVFTVNGAKGNVEISKIKVYYK